MVISDQPRTKGSKKLLHGGIIDCACLIHGTEYDWGYVEKLHGMISRNSSFPIRMHVYTEPHRTVPAPYIKHELEDWGISGAKKAWWYKMQLFNPAHYAGPLLYFDLDVVITGTIDWMWHSNLDYFWAVKDFRYLWRPSHVGINSSIMWWNTTKFNWVWDNLKKNNLPNIFQKFHGDQDYISDVVPLSNRRFFNETKIKSWRWQTLDGGYDFQRKKWKQPGTGTVIPADTSVLVFHGHPKPCKIQDPVVLEYWQ
jgi:hypothetical protein